MYSRQLEQLARRRQSELSQAARTGRRQAEARRAARPPIRSQTGWALVAIGLRIAASGGR
jgi:hypothetical protein